VRSDFFRELSVTARSARTITLTASQSNVPSQSFATQSPGSPDRSRRYKTFYEHRVKRCLDVALVVLAAPVFVPVVGLVALLSLLNGGNPFYVQERVGLNGRTFRMWKLRSMVCDADAKLEVHLAADPEARLEWDTAQKLKNDPRVTRIGSVLRKT
jgi:exopolysaccharide production protein ExoY